MQGSIWAASAAELLARTEGAQQKTPESRLPYYNRIAELFPTSPYYAYALRETARTYDDAGQQAKAEEGYQALLEKKPDSPYRTEAMRFLLVRTRERGDRVNAEKWARAWTQDPPIQEKFSAWLALAEILKEKGDLSGAKQAAAETIKAAKAFKMAAAAEKVNAAPGQIVTWENQAQEAETKAKAIQQN
jgi:tetratricopeptide (TPR) repeat protein